MRRLRRCTICCGRCASAAGKTASPAATEAAAKADKSAANCDTALADTVTSFRQRLSDTVISEDAATGRVYITTSLPVTTTDDGKVYYEV